MSRWSQGFLALLAASLAFCAVHLEIAAGSDLKAGIPRDAGLFGSRGVQTIGRAPVASTVVNRGAKADRMASNASAAAGPTIVFRVTGLKNTSVATFLSASRPAPAAASGPARRAIITTAACEPPVSALTEVAAKLETGRCVT